MRVRSSATPFAPAPALARLALTPARPQVEATSRKEKAKQRPLALNTVEMLRVASSALGKCRRWSSLRVL